MDKTGKQLKLTLEVIIDDVEYLNIEEALETIREMGSAEIVNIEVLMPEGPNV